MLSSPAPPPPRHRQASGEMRETQGRHRSDKLLQPSREPRGRSRPVREGIPPSPLRRSARRSFELRETLVVFAGNANEHSRVLHRRLLQIHPLEGKRRDVFGLESQKLEFVESGFGSRFYPTLCLFGFLTGCLCFLPSVAICALPCKTCTAGRNSRRITRHKLDCLRLI